MATFVPSPSPDPDDASFAAQLVRRFEPWLTPDLEAFLRVVASMFDQVTTYVLDTEDEEGWVILFDPDLCPYEALPFLAQLVGETLPVGIPEANAREWIKDNPNARRGTPQSVFLAAQRHLTGTRSVSMFERYAGVVDQVAIQTNTSETPDPAQTRLDILSTLPADVLLDYSAVAGQSWNNVKSTYANWTAVKVKTWDELTTGLTGWDHFERPM